MKAIDKFMLLSRCKPTTGSKQNRTALQSSLSRVSVYIGALAIGLVPTVSQAGIGRCVLQVKHKTYLDGPCQIGINDGQGSFTIGVGDNRRSKYFAYVNMESDGAHGYWNETADSSHAQTSLGILKKHGACWENDLARICAYR